MMTYRRTEAFGSTLGVSVKALLLALLLSGCAGQVAPLTLDDYEQLQCDPATAPAVAFDYQHRETVLDPQHDVAIVCHCEQSGRYFCWGHEPVAPPCDGYSLSELEHQPACELGRSASCTLDLASRGGGSVTFTCRNSDVTGPHFESN